MYGGKDGKLQISCTVDGSKDYMISCFKEGKKCADCWALLQADRLNFNDGSLYVTPFGLMEEDVIKAASFYIIEEHDVDDDFEQNI